MFWLWRRLVGRSRCALTGIPEPRGPSPQALNLLGGVRFIAWHLRRSSLGECRQGPRHFGSGPTKKRPCATVIRLVGQSTNTTITPKSYLEITRHSCCNGYRCSKWLTQIQTLDEAVCISLTLCAYTLGKGMHSTILPPARGKL